MAYFPHIHIPMVQEAIQKYLFVTSLLKWLSQEGLAQRKLLIFFSLIYF